MNLFKSIDCSFSNEAPISFKLPPDEKSIGQYLLQAFNGSNSPPDFKALAIN